MNKDKKKLKRLREMRKNNNFKIETPKLIPHIPVVKEDPNVIIQEGIDGMFNMSFENQQWEHMWNLEEYEKNRIQRYENEFPCDD